MLDKSLAKVTKNGDLPCENRHIPKAGVRKGEYTGLADGGKDPVKYGRNTVKQRRRPLLPGQGAWRGRQRGAVGRNGWILQETVKMTQKPPGKSSFTWEVCVNGLKEAGGRGPFGR